MRRLLVVAALAALLATPARAAAPTSFQVLLLAPTHRPVATAPWPYAVVVRNAKGKLVPARIHLQITFGGLAVGQIGRHAIPGFWAETLEWPRTAIGQAVTLELDAVVAGATKTIRFPVTTVGGAVPKRAPSLRVVGSGNNVAAAVGNVRAPRAAALAVRAAGPFAARWSVNCNKPTGTGTTLAAGAAAGKTALQRTLAIPRPATQDCAIGAVATSAGRVSVTLTGR